MSIHIDALRDIAANHGWSVCDEVADEIEADERAYALLFAENAKLRKALDAAQELAARQAADYGLWFEAKTAPEAHLQTALRELAATILPPNRLNRP